MSDRAIWELVVECARELTARGVTPFTRGQLIACVETKRLDVGRSSVDPIIQGLTVNASGGPRSAGGTPLRRVDRGQYVLNEAGATAVPRQARSERTEDRAQSGRSTLTMWGPQRRRVVEPRVRRLIEYFDRYVALFDEQVPFQRSGQYSEHRKTIETRRHYGDVRVAIADDRFLEQVWRTLQTWGIGKRGSRLASLPAFTAAVRAQADRLTRVERSAIDHPDLDVAATAEQLWPLVAALDVVENTARIVAATKTLHHLLPEVVPPMDRAWTGAFFAWNPQDPQNDQQRTFCETYGSMASVALQVRPSLFVGPGWRTSSTKILDNAVIGFCLHEKLGPARENGSGRQ